MAIEDRAIFKVALAIVAPRLLEQIVESRTALLVALACHVDLMRAVSKKITLTLVCFGERARAMKLRDYKLEVELRSG